MIVDPDFPDHWKTRTLVGLLGGDEVAPIYVIRLWAHCQNRRQFVFDSLSSEALKALCHFPGPANKLESSLVSSGFVRRDAKVLIVHAWDEYNSSLIAAWNNGKKGGRPPTKKPVGSDSESHGKPRGLRIDKRGIDEKGEEKIDPPKSPKGDLITCQEFFDRWNRFVSGKPKLKPALKLTDKRRDKIKTRLSDPAWFNDFLEAVKLLPLGGDGWQPDLDWIVNSEHNIYRILEGAYDWRIQEDPALQKLEKAKRQSAAKERKIEVEQQKLQEQQSAPLISSAIENILNPTGGNGEEIEENNLLFG
jgi:hypothetical protein